MKLAGWHGLVLLVLWVSPCAAETGSALKSEEIKAEPFRDAKVVGTLVVGDKVNIMKKDGGWLQVKSARGKGWVRMLSIRRGEARKAGADVGGLLGLASGRAGSGRMVATTGIRGLSEEELKAAKFDGAELKRAEAYAVSGAEARRFAAQGKLVVRPFDYLPAE
ncbi:MAG: SH3 domain-containing protein [Pseudomonadota bacterium]